MSDTTQAVKDTEDLVQTLRDALDDCVTVMETAAIGGVRSCLAPQAQDDWARAHIRAEQLVDMVDRA